MSKTILIVDDDPDISDLLAARLNGNGYETIIADDGVVAVEKARNNNPDLIILDVMMPKLDGFNVARMLKFDENLKDIPIIIFSARDQQMDKELGTEVKVDAYLEKSCPPEELLATINRLIGA